MYLEVIRASMEAAFHNAWNIPLGTAQHSIQEFLVFDP